MPLKNVEDQIYREYRSRGYTAAKARRIARATTYGVIERKRRRALKKRTKRRPKSPKK